MSPRTYYEILDISPTATPDSIRESYRILVAVWRPDRFQPASKQYAIATEKLKEINAAYEVLQDPRTREEYDRALAGEQEAEPLEGSHPARFTPEQEREIERNRQRYRQALESAAVQKFCEALGYEPARRAALGNLDRYQVTLAKEILARYVLARGG
jgi:molecular chaperone DnaJ